MSSNVAAFARIILPFGKLDRRIRDFVFLLSSYVARFSSPWGGALTQRGWHMKMKLAGAVALLLAAAMPVAASATIATITYTGTTTAGETYDGAGLFGAAGSSFDGDAFKLTYTLDTNSGFQESFCNSGTCTSFAGASYYGSPSIPLTANLTINGDTVHFFGNNESNDRADQSTPCTSFCSETGQDIEDSNGNTYLYTTAQSLTNTNLFPLNLTSPFDVATNGTDIVGNGEFAITEPGGAETYADFTADRVTLTVSAAPEPTTWVLMFVGVGFVGGALRMRREPLRTQTAS